MKIYPQSVNDALQHFSVTIAELQKIITEALCQGADYADLFFEHSFSNNISLRDGEVNKTSSNIDYGVGIRVVVGDQTGYAYIENTDIKAMLKAAQTARAIATMPASDNMTKASKELSFKNHYTIKKHWFDVSIDKKKSFIQQLNDKILSMDSSIIKVNVSFSDSTRYILFYNSEGTICYDNKPMSVLYCSCTMEKNGKIENGTASYASQEGGEVLTSELIDNLSRKAVEQTRVMFEAKKPKGGEMSVVMGAGSSGILLHEAIGHAFEADFNRKNTSIFSDKLGKSICSSEINVVDDGTFDHMRGSINFDDEGIESQKTYIVKDGVLESYLHDRISARHYGVEPTGNGRRQSFRYAPLPRMRVTYMESGNVDENDIIASVKQGIYVDNFTNGQVQIGAGDFTFFVKTGYMIENGKLTHPIKDINIIGNGPKALADITMIGNNLKIDTGAWTCGKDGQSVPVGQGLPSVLVSKLTVGGI